MAKTKSRVLSLVLVFFVAFAAMWTFNLDTSYAAVKKIHLKKTTITLVKGKTYQQKLLDKRGKVISATKVKWKSLKTSVAKISKKGKVTAVKAGTAKMTAKYKGKTYKFTVKVKNPPQNTTISVDQPDLTIGLGEMATLIVFTDKGEDIEYTCNNSNVECEWGDWLDNGTDSYFYITGEAVGSSVVTVRDSYNKAVKATINVTVVDNRPSNKSISIEPSSISVGSGETKQVTVVTDNGEALTASVSNTNATAKWGSWISGTNSVTLNITGVREGSAVVTVYDKVNNSVSATLLVTITKPVTPVTEVKFYSSNKTELGVGDTAAYKTTISPSTATDKTLTWTSSDESVATVDDQGNVTALKGGSTVIRATATSGVYAECTLNVIDVQIALPALPASYNNYSSSGTLNSTCSIEKVEFEKTYYTTKSAFSVKMYLYGTKTYDKAASTSSACKVGYKLYDADGYVVESGTFYSDSVVPGEKFKGYTYLSTNLAPGSYRLELLNVKS